MKIQNDNYFISLAAALFVVAATVHADNLKDVEITDEFPLARCMTTASLVTSCAGGDCNAYLPLDYASGVGREWVLDNADCVAEGACEELEQVTITLLGEESVDGENTRIMREIEEVDGELTEVSHNFLNQCSNTQDVYYWGEEVCVAEGSDGALEEEPFEYHTIDCETDYGLVPGAGAWRADEDGEPGILFPGGAFLLGARYLQEDAPEIARDWATNAAMGLTADDPADDEFEDCVLALDRNLIEDPKSKEEGDEKVYCPGIGLVRDEELVLTSCATSTAVACTQL